MEFEKIEIFGVTNEKFTEENTQIFVQRDIDTAFLISVHNAKEEKTWNDNLKKTYQKVYSEKVVMELVAENKLLMEKLEKKKKSLKIFNEDYDGLVEELHDCYVEDRVPDYSLYSKFADLTVKEEE